MPHKSRRSPKWTQSVSAAFSLEATAHREHAVDSFQLLVCGLDPGRVRARYSYRRDTLSITAPLQRFALQLQSSVLISLSLQCSCPSNFRFTAGFDDSASCFTKSSTFSLSIWPKPRGSSLPDFSWRQNKPHAFGPQRGRRRKSSKKVCSSGGSRNATECSGAAYRHAESSRLSRRHAAATASERRPKVTERQ